MIDDVGGRDGEVVEEVDERLSAGKGLKVMMEGFIAVEVEKRHTVY